MALHCKSLLKIFVFQQHTQILQGPSMLRYGTYKELHVKINAKILSQVDTKCSLQTKQVYLADSFSTSTQNPIRGQHQHYSVK